MAGINERSEIPWRKRGKNASEKKLLETVVENTLFSPLTEGVQFPTVSNLSRILYEDIFRQSKRSETPMVGH